jgi:hypothetical protein
MWDGHVTARADVTPAPRLTNVHSGNKTDITIHTYVYDGKFDEYIVTDKQATAMREDLAMRSRDSKILVEFLDYLPAKSELGKECRAWYLVGIPIVGTGETPLPVIYTLVFDKTEVEMFTYVDATPFNNVRIPGTPIEHAVKDARGVSGRIVTLFASNMEVVENAETLQ